MMRFGRNFGIKVRDLKCYEDWQGFDAIYPINIIIGRNNAGKSTLLDLVCRATSNKVDGAGMRRFGTQEPEARMRLQITRDMIDAIISDAEPVGSSRVDLQACKLEYSIVSPK